MRNGVALTFACCGAALVGFAWFWSRPTMQADLPLPQRLQNTSSATGLIRRTDNFSTAAAASDKAAARVTPSMLQKLNDSKNYRAFIHDAYKNAAAGGVQYGFVMMGGCKGFTSPALSQTTYSEARRHAHAELVRRCDMTEAERKQMFSQLAYDRTSSLMADPLVTAAISLAGAASLREKSAAVNHLLIIGDPLVMEALLSPDQHAQDSIFFNGKWFTGKEDETRMLNAIKLVRCELGMDCGADSYFNLRQCADDGHCAGSVADGVRASLNDEAEFLQTSALAAQIVTQIKRKNAGAFIAPTFK